MNAFVSISFLLMSATAGVNLLVCLYDRHGHFEKGDLIDRRCRWIFPIAHFLCILTAFLVLFPCY